jgi:lipoprotein-anchoring transpeptidase ErfK/SrfK
MARRLAIALALIAVAGPSPVTAAVPPATQATTPESPAEPGPLVVPPPPPGERQGAKLLRRTGLRATPGGRTVRTLGTKTEFGSPAVLAVVGRRPGWLAVLSEHRPNGRAGWIPAENAEIVRERYRIDVSLRTRRLTVRRGDRVLRRVTVAIGAAGTETPTGRYAVTDGLRFDREGAYGCCALALSGRQPDLPQGWPGGDRLAIHGTPNEASVGEAVSLGCMRTRDRDIRWLVRTVPLGTIVTVRA